MQLSIPISYQFDPATEVFDFAPTATGFIFRKALTARNVTAATGAGGVARMTYQIEVEIPFDFSELGTTPEAVAGMTLTQWAARPFAAAVLAKLAALLGGPDAVAAYEAAHPGCSWQPAPTPEPEPEPEV